MIRSLKAALAAGALVAFPTPILSVSFQLETDPIRNDRPQRWQEPSSLPFAVEPANAGFDAQAILETTEPAFCKDGVCPSNLIELALIESGREAPRISGLLSPIDQRLLDLFEGRPPEPAPGDLLFDEL